MLLLLTARCDWVVGNRHLAVVDLRYERLCKRGGSDGAVQIRLRLAVAASVATAPIPGLYTRLAGAKVDPTRPAVRQVASYDTSQALRPLRCMAEAHHRNAEYQGPPGRIMNV